MERIAFLTYMNRSGSTFLANLLNEYEDVGVSIEARMPDGILFRPLEISKPHDVKRAMEVLYSDGKFCAWNIDKEELEREISNLTFPVNYKQLLRTVLKAFFKNRKVKIFIYKNGFYIKHIKEVRARFHDAKFIFILRDARAIYNSQKVSINSETGKPMANNPVPVAKYYKGVSSIIDDYNNFDWIHVLKYEDLVCNTDYEIKRLLTFLGCGERKNLGGEKYLAKIPEREKHLHTKVNAGPLKERIGAWVDELSKAEIMIIQRISGEVLRKYGYDLVRFDTISIKDEMDYLWYWLTYYVSMLRFIIELAIKRLGVKENDFYKSSRVEAEFDQVLDTFKRKGREIGKQLRILFKVGFCLMCSIWKGC